MNTKLLAIVLSMTFVATNAFADDATCVANAEKALAGIGKALNLGENVGHADGGQVLKRAKNINGDVIVTVGGAALTDDNIDGYLTATGATVEMIETKAGCEVNKLSIMTGADFHAYVERESKKASK